MTSDDQHGKECFDVLSVVYGFLDGEIDEASRDGIRAHLDECAPCLRQYGIEQEVKALVARCCGSDRAPDELRLKVISRIREVQIQLSSNEYRPN